MKQLPINLGGNYCGHDRHAPQFRLVDPIQLGKGGIPGILPELIKRLSKYYESPMLLPSLNHANGSTRQQRSCRREACINMLAIILKHTNLTTLRVGIPTTNGFFNISLKWLAGKTHLSYSRAERAYKDLRLSGIITTNQFRKKTEDGKWVASNAVKSVSVNLFNAFGLGARLKKERSNASKRESRAVAKESPSINSRARASLYISMLGKRPKKGSALAKPESQPELTDEEKKAYQHTLIRLKRENPNMDSKSLRVLARNSIKA